MDDQHGAAVPVSDTAAAAVAQQSLTASVAAAADGGNSGPLPPSNGCLVQEGDTVVLEVNRERYSFVHIKRGGCGCAAWLTAYPLPVALQTCSQGTPGLHGLPVIRVVPSVQEGAGGQEGLLG